MSSAPLLGLCLLLAARPVAKPYRGPLDGLDVRAQSASVLARFDGVDQQKAQQTLDAVVAKLGLSAPAVRVAFIQTKVARLAAITVMPQPPLSFGRFTALARELSERPGVAEAWAVLTPGARDPSLEGEAVFDFVHGAAAQSERIQYRDHDAWIELLRRRIPASAWRLSRWPDFPASRLAKQLGLPGRSCLDEPWQLSTLTTEPWPDDAGDNLALVTVDLPGGMAAELQQWALRVKKSPSAVVSEALAQAREAQALGHAAEDAAAAPYDEGQPDAEKHARRALMLFLPAAELEPAQDAGAGQASSLSRVVQRAWRRAHPFKAASKP